MRQNTVYRWNLWGVMYGDAGALLPKLYMTRALANAAIHTGVWKKARAVRLIVHSFPANRATTTK